MERCIIWQRDRCRLVLCHHTHGQRGMVGGHAHPIEAQPVPLREVHDHWGAAAGGDHAPGGGPGRQPTLLEPLAAAEQGHAVLAIQNQVGPAVAVHDGRWAELPDERLACANASATGNTTVAG